MMDGRERQEVYGCASEAVARAQHEGARADALAAEVERLTSENEHVKAALTEPCAECGHIDWRADGYLDPFVARAEVAEAEVERLREALRQIADGAPRSTGEGDTVSVIMDFPQAWAYVRERAIKHDTDEHDPRCSFVTENGALLCDCDVLWDEYERRGGTRPGVPAEEST